ncbi:sodium:solute symporter family transporter [Actinorugispora endophytica]|uniref:Sodium:solute symporter family protein n=1 Tax=Actinorugispora endophytica TaxID=1605990 RepID=A0A4R6V311_9ACTN|nr:hypothetical protein [Actinorugispora endophytica]TDQ52527.1 sodium:solute symporter family protein [Actinorugispora endophytica]
MIELVVGGLLVIVVMLGVLGVVGFLGGRGATTDFTLATRRPRTLFLGAAVTGEYVSAMTVLGLASLVFAEGFGTAWVFTASTLGYLLVAAFVVAPLRRAGVYSHADFAEWRLGSRGIRRTVSLCVVVIGWILLVSQYIAAGLLVRVFTGLPEWLGWIAAAVVTLPPALLAAGGSSSRFQAMSLWFKLVAVGVPAVVLLVLWQSHGGKKVDADTTPVLHADTVVRVDRDQPLRVAEPTRVAIVGDGEGGREHVWTVLEPGVHQIRAGTVMLFEAGAAVPHHGGLTPLHGGDWADLGVTCGLTHGEEWEDKGVVDGLLHGYSVYLTLALGIIGMPQFVARFHSTPSPRTARRLVVLMAALSAVFALLALVYAGLGRVYAGALLITGETDLLVLELPRLMAPGPLGTGLGLLLGAGVASAVVTVSIGFVSAMGGTISQCVPGRGVWAYRVGTVVSAVVPLALLAAVPGLSREGLVEVVLAALELGAVTIAPLLLLGIWWGGLTGAGAAAGLATGIAGIAAARAGEISGPLGVPVADTLMYHPALGLVPLVFGVMVGVSLLTRGRLRGDAAAVLARMHLPGSVTGRRL